MPDSRRRRSIAVRTLSVAAVIAFVAGVAAASQLTGDPPRGPAAAGGPASTDAGPSAARASARRTHRYVSPGGDDAAAGTREQPWRTVTHAASRVRAGMTVHVAPGRYGGPVRISRGGTDGRPVRFVSDRRWGASIRASSPDRVTVILILGANVIFEGFDVSASGGDGTAGIEASGSHGAVVGNRIHDISMPCLRAGNGGAGIVIGSARVDYRTRDMLVERNVVSNVGDGPRDGRCRLVHGIYAEVPDTAIVNNIVDGAAGDGITSWHAARSLTIANNLSTRNGGNGITVGTGGSGSTSTGHTGTVVANNILQRNARFSISEATDGVRRARRNRYLDNLIHDNRLDGSAPLRERFNDPEVSGTVTADPALPSGAVPAAYDLPARSPAVDAGTCVAAPRRDIGGVLRPQGRAVDIGPYERRSKRGRC